MRMPVARKAAIFDLLCGTEHVFFVVDDPSGQMGIMFKMHYVEQPCCGNLFFSARSLFAGAYSFRQQFGSHTYRARDLSNASEVKAYCLDRWMKFTENGNPILHNGRVLLPAYATYEELLIRLDLQGRRVALKLQNLDVMKKHPLEKICFVLEKYKSKYMLDPEKWHFILRWIEMPWSDVQTAFKRKDWYFTLRPALESGCVTAEQMKILEHCHRDEDLPEALLKLSLHGVNPMIVFEEVYDHLTKIEDLTTGEMLFKAERDKA